jgi:hypothetical protein
MIPKLANGLNQFYAEIAAACEQGPNAMWAYAEEFAGLNRYNPDKIRNVRLALISNFFKEIGFTQFIKVDRQVKTKFPVLIDSVRQNILPELQSPPEHYSDKKIFLRIQEISTKIFALEQEENLEDTNMNPFMIDKIIYIHGAEGLD